MKFVPSIFDLSTEKRMKGNGFLFFFVRLDFLEDTKFLQYHQMIFNKKARMSALALIGPFSRFDFIYLHKSDYQAFA